MIRGVGALPFGSGTGAGSGIGAGAGIGNGDGADSALAPTAGATPHSGPGVDRRVVLEVRAAAGGVSRFGRDGRGEPGAGDWSPAAEGFPVGALRDVVAGPLLGGRAIGGSSLRSVGRALDPDAPAAPGYRALLGPLEILGRWVHVLEFTVDGRRLDARSGTVDAAVATIRERVRGRLRHRGIASRTLSPDISSRHLDEWDRAPVEHRSFVDLRGGPPAHPAPPERPTPAPPAVGSGIVVGADSAGRAVCLDLCGPHLGRVALLAGTDTVERLLLRVSALGWRVSVVTETPDRWHALSVAAGIEVRFANDEAAVIPVPISEPIRARGSHGRTDRSPAVDCDLLVWDSESGPPPALVHHGDPCPTVCVLATGTAESREARYARELAARTELVVDGRIPGHLTLERARCASLPRSRLTVDEVWSREEDEHLLRARAVPAAGATLAR